MSHFGHFLDDVEPVNDGRAGRRRILAGQHRHRRTFSGSVVPQQSRYLVLEQIDGSALDGHFWPECLEVIQNFVTVTRLSFVLSSEMLI